MCVCVSVTAVSRQPLVRYNWNLPDISLWTWVCAFSRFDIVLLHAPIQSLFTRAKEWPVWLLFLARGLKVFYFFFCTYGHALTGTHIRARTYGPALVILIIMSQHPSWLPPLPSFHSTSWHYMSIKYLQPLSSFNHPLLAAAPMPRPYIDTYT